MDIRLPERRPWRIYLLAAGFSLLFCFGLYQLASPAIPAVSLKEYVLVEVQQSDIALYTDALGELFASQQLLLTAPAQGAVIEVLQRPGALVQADTAILRLDNPELDLKVQAAASNLKKMQAELSAFHAQQQSELLEQQGRLAELAALLEQAELETNLNMELVERGIAANIELQRAKLRLRQQQQKLDFEQQKFTQFSTLQKAELEQKHVQLKQLEEELNLLQKQQYKMLVTAGIAGYLQQLDVELGQSVIQGAALARVGSQQKLSARIYINQRQADQVAVGSSVIIDSRRGLIEGRIHRLEALVENGTVAAEVSLPDDLPAGLRPSLQITASVLLGERSNALYIPQQTGLRPNSSERVFVQGSAGLAQARQVRFGELSNQQLLIESGLEAGERFIAVPSDLWPDQSLLQLKHQK
ncbi:efflux RND transporter periplasmic adaptor subunit [Rheinheimera soli]|uniref:efflux RND transporter periplasmic adaptor subunit n=1 Tax=Rheinheimera soli TaxID=443616 RepID=UPI001E2A1733|nr:HlyD family efflux transporter periplasmic adaptor subunit [Rheinheimera soli]